MAAAKRIAPDQCCGLIIDVQGFFLSQVERRLRSRIRANTAYFVRLLDYFKIPIVVTLERPVDQKGALPREISRHLGDRAATFDKDFFDLCKERPIRNHIRALKKKQAIVAGCETDVCVLQSCLGLLDLGYEVYLVEELLFSSASNVQAAMTRMQAAGAVSLTYKTLYYELIEAVGDSPHDGKLLRAFGAMPRDIPDAAV